MKNNFKRAIKIAQGFMEDLRREFPNEKPVWSICLKEAWVVIKEQQQNSQLSTEVKKSYKYVTKEEIKDIIEKIYYREGKNGVTRGIKRYIERGDGQFISADVVYNNMTNLFNDDNKIDVAYAEKLPTVENCERYIELIEALKEFGRFAKYDWLIAGAEYHFEKNKKYLLEEYGGEAEKLLAESIENNKLGFGESVPF